MYIHVCTVNVWCTEGYIHFMKCTDIVEHGTYTVQTSLNTVRTLLYLFDSAFLHECKKLPLTRIELMTFRVSACYLNNH